MADVSPRTTAGRRSVVVLAAFLVLGACGGGNGLTGPHGQAGTTTAAVPGGPTTTARPTTESPRATPSNPRPGDPCAVGRQPPPTGPVAATFATALAFAPDGRLFFAERAGAIRVVQSGATKTFATVPTVTTEAGGGYSERGLLGLAISPTFATDRFVYAFYSSTNRARQEVARWTDCGGTGRDMKVIVELPGGTDCCHKGGRLAFGPDGKLYVTLGEEHVATAAADPSDVRGKVLRYNPDGSVPTDNPFGAGNPVWASGFRNPFGIAFSATGQLAVTSNGPTGDAGSPSTGYDVVTSNVAKGSAYQWPACYGYSHPIREASCDGREPEWSSEARAVVPTGATFVNASGPRAYAGKLVFCTLNQGMLVLTDRSPTEGSPHATVVQGEAGCLLDVTQGPDNALYFSNTDSINRVG